MTQSNRDGVGRVGRLQELGQIEQHLHHLADLVFVGTPPAGDGFFDLVGRILGHFATRRGRFGHHETTDHAH